MNLTRRLFLQQVSLLTAAAAAQSAHVAGHAAEHQMTTPAQPAGPLLDTNALARYVDSLPIPARARPSGLRPDPKHPTAHIPYYRVAMRQFQTKVHGDMGPTTFWGYDGYAPAQPLRRDTESPS
jgi:spore coat protein A